MGEEEEEFTRIKVRAAHEENPYDVLHKLKTGLPQIEYTSSAPIDDNVTDIIIELLDLWKKTLKLK